MSNPITCDESNRCMTGGPWVSIPPRSLGILVSYGIAHMIVDASCAALVVMISRTDGSNATRVWGLIVSYSVLAFGLQPFVGSAVDRWRRPRFAAATGCLLIVCAVGMLYSVPELAIGLAGVGNALFHVGGGGVSLNCTPDRATAPGVFVAPGALGLAGGALSATNGLLPIWWFALLLIGVAAALSRLPIPEMDYRRRELNAKASYVELLLLLLCFSVAVRSLIGMVVVAPWRPNPTVLLMLAGAAALGKGIGGILADRFGWLPVAMVSVLTSVPLVCFGAAAPHSLVLGMLLFQVVMSVTLVAIARLFPGQPSFAFGLPCLALVIGAMPVLVGYERAFANPWTMSLFLLLSAAALLKSLTALAHLRPQTHPDHPIAGTHAQSGKRPSQGTVR
ncbi:MAG: MFS transporter [bacterium]|nr:MFS transporter [bacterium]